MTFFSQVFGAAWVAAVAEWYRHRIVAGFVTSSSPVPLKTRRVGQRCTLNLSRAETSSRWCGVLVRRGVPAQVSSTFIDHGSKLRGPSPKALVQLISATLIFTHSLGAAWPKLAHAPLKLTIIIISSIPLFQSGFRKGRSTLDNIIQLESKIKNAFVRRNHLVSIFFDIEKAYDRTWRYGILRTLFNFGLRVNLPNFIQKFLNLRTFRASLYVDDLQISCEGSDMRMIERQLQTAVNNIVKWCDNNGHSISASKSCCVHFCRKRGIHPDPEIRIRAVQIPVVHDVRFLGVIFDRRLTFLPHILQLRKRCEKSLNLLKVLSNTSWGADRTSLLRVYQEIVLSRIDYGCVVYGSTCNSTLKKLDPCPPYGIENLLGKSTVAPVVFQRVFAYHRSQYSRYSAIYTDGSKRADYVGCGVVIEDIMRGYRLGTSCSIFTAEAVAIYRAIQLIDSNMPRKNCIYTDSMSVLEALENYNDRCYPVVCKILDITSRLYSKGLDIVFCWLPSHVGIIGNEQADSAAKSATTHLPLAVRLSDMKRVIMHHIFKIWQESWSQQLDNKLHSVKPVIGAWPVMPMRRTDVKLTVFALAILA
ncbi:putative RNA-directed DNA polymerase from transposon X-element [Trichonephila clavipes]|nr:putative RNA-directed DNA polymerase from transposon X-element [Trichonephila clavipes]